LTQRANALQEKIRTATNALSRSLLKPQIVEMEKEVSALRQKVRDLNDAANLQLREINSAWQDDRAGQFASLSKLYFTFAYLGRWSAQLEELAFHLSP